MPTMMMKLTTSARAKTKKAAVSQTRSSVVTVAPYVAGHWCVRESGNLSLRRARFDSGDYPKYQPWACIKGEERSEHPSY
jgi:hypothetical protein